MLFFIHASVVSEPKWLNAQSSKCSYPVLIMFMPSSLWVRFFTVKEQKRLQVEAPSVIAYYVLHMCVLYGTTPSRSKRYLFLNQFYCNICCTFPQQKHGISTAAAVTGGRIMERCSFHLVPHFEECSPGVTANCEFNFWELHETFPISTVWLLYHKALWNFLVYLEGTLYPGIRLPERRVLMPKNLWRVGKIVTFTQPNH